MKTSRPFTAQYGGSCYRCAEPIQPGQAACFERLGKLEFHYLHGDGGYRCTPQRKVLIHAKHVAEQAGKP